MLVLQFVLSAEQRVEAAKQVEPSDEQRREFAALAAKTGKLGCLEVLDDWGYPMEDSTWAAAAAEGHVDTLRWLHQLAPEEECGEEVSQRAAEAGHLDCLIFLYSIDARWDSWTTALAARHGHLPCLAFLMSHGCPFDANTSSGAGFGGHIDCLRHLRTHGCLWDWETTGYAAGQGHLDCLKFAVERGCAVDDYAFVAAIEGTQPACLEYLLERGFRPEAPLEMAHFQVRVRPTVDHYAPTIHPCLRPCQGLRVLLFGSQAF